MADRLGCAVVAMRYPVVDDFAIAFAEELYERLLGVRDAQPGSRGQPLDIALARAVAARGGPGAVPGPAGAVAGHAGAAGRRRRPGWCWRCRAGSRTWTRRWCGWRRSRPSRSGSSAGPRPWPRASAVLAPGSGQAGVLLHGMAGSGKTACALELAYRHQDSFAAAAFWQAPLADDEFGGALASLAAQLEVQLGEFGFAMSDKITTIESLAGSPRGCGGCWKTPGSCWCWTTWKPCSPPPGPGGTRGGSR